MNQYRVTLTSGFKFNVSGENEEGAKAKVQKVLDRMSIPAAISHVELLESQEGA